ncbi:MAG: hypothetical protein JSV03_17705 [Planctomycetota bacterium]|nr:MAG: hypothetical protein JSV03_17705 [Planctomycetota bacterium]
MNRTQHLFQNQFLLFSLTIGLVLAFSTTSLAPPKGGPKGGPKSGPKAGPKKAGPKPGPKVGPKPGPKAGPKPAGKKVHPGPKAGHKPPKAKVKVRPPIKKVKPSRFTHLRRHRRYWHPKYYYLKGKPATTWSVIGYPYYVGGTSYVVTTPSEESVSSDESAPIYSAGQEYVDEKYQQLQELVELTHEWRTINESPEFHQRIMAANTSEETKHKVVAIKNKNRQFDKATRSAMLAITQGKSADSQLEKAGNHLDELIQLVESLPEATVKNNEK